MKPLTFPAPAREWFKGQTGLWSSRPWGRAACLSAFAGGAWFDFSSNLHDFEPEVRSWCQEAQQTYRVLAIRS